MNAQTLKLNQQIEAIRHKIANTYGVPYRSLVPAANNKTTRNTAEGKARIVYRYLLWRFVDLKIEAIAAECEISRESFTDFMCKQRHMQKLDRTVQNLVSDIIHDPDNRWDVMPWERILFVAMPDYTPTRRLKNAMRRLVDDLDVELRQCNSALASQISYVKLGMKLED